MTDPRALQLAYDALVGDFLVPLLEGGPVRVGVPIAPGCASFFASTSATSPRAEERFLEACDAAVSKYVAGARLRWPAPNFVAFAAGAYDLLVLTDPALDRAFARRARTTIRSWVGAWLALASVPRTRGEALARHVVVERLRALRRRDLVVKTWAYTYRFFGRPVPANVVALPKLRFVRTQETFRALAEILSLRADARGIELDLPGLWQELEACSPLTQLLDVLTRPESSATAPFRFTPGAFAVLSDNALRGVVASHLARDDWKSGGVLGASLVEPEAFAVPVHAAIAIQLLLEMHLVAVLDGRPVVPPARSLEDPGVQRYAALLVAAFEDERAWAELRALDDDHCALVKRRTAALRERLPGSTLAKMRAVLGDALAHEPPYLPR